jgi:hypothetical protein
VAASHKVHNSNRLAGETIHEWYARTMDIWHEQMRGMMGGDAAKQLYEAVGGHHLKRLRELERRERAIGRRLFTGHHAARFG